MALAELNSDSKPTSESTSALLRELVAHLGDNRTQLREEWIRRITEGRLLTAMTKEEIFAEATSVYDSYVEALETRTLETLQAYAQNLSERIIPRGVETHISCKERAVRRDPGAAGQCLVGPRRVQTLRSTACRFLRPAALPRQRGSVIPLPPA